MKSLPEITWQYDIEKRRPFTDEEMIAKRDEIRFPDPVFTTLHTESRRAKVRDFRLNKFDQLRTRVDFTKFPTYAQEPFEDTLIQQQDVEFEDVTEEEVTDIEDK